MIELVTISCSTCGRQHVVKIATLTDRPACPFCGEPARQAAVAEAATGAEMAA